MKGCGGLAAAGHGQQAGQYAASNGVAPMPGMGVHACLLLVGVVIVALAPCMRVRGGHAGVPMPRRQRLLPGV
jgi:hypothetical protein